MNLKICFSFFLIFIVIALVVYSCKDLGSEVSPITKFNASSTDVTVIKDSSTQIILTGGVQPYLIKAHPNNAVASISLSSSTLIILGIDTGSTNTTIYDSESPAPDSVQINISVAVITNLVLFASQIQPIFNNRCIGCHGSNGGLNLSSGISYGDLVNVQAQSSCTSLKRVLPGDAGNSVLYKKISGSTCGNKMPGSISLNSSDIVLIENWINQGAINN